LHRRYCIGGWDVVISLTSQASPSGECRKMVQSYSERRKSKQYLRNVCQIWGRCTLSFQF
jgi:hypothetical protein